MQQEPRKLSSKLARLWARLSRSKVVRQRFVESHSAKAIAFQIRAMRRTRDWSQEDLAVASGMTQNMISRLESPEYGRSSVTTLRRIAAAFDVALAVRFVAFSELAEWVATLSPDRMDVRSFDKDNAHGRLTLTSRDTSAYYYPTPATRNPFHELTVTAEKHSWEPGRLVMTSGDTGSVLNQQIAQKNGVTYAQA